MKKDLFVVTWEWRENNNEWKLYTGDINKRIEKLEVGKSLTFTTQNNDQRYKVMRNTENGGIQRNVKTHVRREMRRREQKKAGYIEYPKWWTMRAMNDGSTYTKGELVRVSDNKKWEEVSQSFYNTSSYNNSGNVTITNIESVQNQRLYDNYWSARNILKKSIGEKKLNERYLWHGTKQEETMDKIMKEGFRKEFNATAAYGEGTYFAVNSGYSIGYASNNNGVYKMFQCKVICGESIGGRGSYKLKSWPKKANELIYDSLVSNDGNIYVIHDDVRAYPMFVITFTRS